MRNQNESDLKKIDEPEQWVNQMYGEGKFYGLEVALQKEISGELGEFSHYLIRTFKDNETAMRIFEAEDVGALLLGDWDKELREYVGNFRVAFRVWWGDNLIGEGDKNQLQYAAECIPE